MDALPTARTCSHVLTYFRITHLGLTNSWQLLQGMTIAETVEGGGMISYQIGVRLPYPSPI
jgi:hypothetical protein